MEVISEAVWQAWLRKGQAKERRQAAFRWNVLKWVAGLGLLTAGAVYSDRTPGDIAVRAMVAIGVVIAISKGLRPRLATIPMKEESA